MILESADNIGLDGSNWLGIRKFQSSMYEEAHLGLAVS